MKSPVHAGKTIREARAKLRELELQRRGFERHTLAAYVDHWAENKTRRGRRNVKRAAANLRRHILPTLGHHRLDEIQARAISELAWDLYDESLSAKTIHNVIGYLSSVFKLAVYEELLEANPCRSIPRDELPAAGRNPWRKYEPRDVVALLSNPSIPEDRRVLYALMFYLATREGEGAGLTFDRWDRSVEPLNAFIIDRQYDHQPLKTARDDQTAERRLPVHPELAAILARWKLSGFAAVFGRPPRPGDFVVPSRRTLGARTRNAIYKALVADEKRAGVEHAAGRGTHGFRKAWISMIEDAGAPREEYRVLTHTRPSRDVLEVYVQRSWTSLCATAQRIKLPWDENVIAIGGRRG